MFRHVTSTCDAQRTWLSSQPIAIGCAGVGCASVTAWYLKRSASVGKRPLPFVCAISYGICMTERTLVGKALSVRFGQLDRVMPSRKIAISSMRGPPYVSSGSLWSAPTIDTNRFGSGAASKSSRLCDIGTIVS
jgi:hypothetical protein